MASKIYFEDFLGAATYDASTAFNGFKIHDDSAAGSPSVAHVTGEASGAVKLLLASTSELERVTLYSADILPFDFDNLQSVEYKCKVSGVDAVSVLIWGFANDYNDDEDAIGAGAWFKIEGAASTSAVVVESDDAVINLDDKATGLTLSSSYKRFVIDCNKKNDVKFYMDNASGQLVRVAKSTTFDMSNLTGSVQLMAKCEKASGTGVPALFIDSITVKYKEA